MSDEDVEVNQKMHQELSDFFLKQNLTYKFTSVLLHKATQFPLVHFSFSKPTKTKPVPEVVVTADVRPLGAGEDGVPRYGNAVFFVVHLPREGRPFWSLNFHLSHSSFFWGFL